MLDSIIDTLEDIEKLVLVGTNIILAIFTLINAIRARKWKETAAYIGGQFRTNAAVKLKKSHVKRVLIKQSPLNILSYVNAIFDKK